MCSDIRILHTVGWHIGVLCEKLSIGVIPKFRTVVTNLNLSWNEVISGAVCFGVIMVSIVCTGDWFCIYSLRKEEPYLVFQEQT